MSDDKLEPRLLKLIDEQRIRGSALSQARDVTAEGPIQVTISHQETVQAQETDDREQGLSDLESRVGRTLQPILDKLRELGAEEGAIVHTLATAVTARLTPPQISAMAELGEVKIIRAELLELVTCLNESVHVIEAPQVWTGLHATGENVRVAVLDTGIDKTHPALLGQVVNEVSTASEPITMPGYHATHVAGTVASIDPVYRGVAPAAELLNIKVLTAAGFGQPQWVIQGLHEAVVRGARVASLSLGWSELWGWVCDDGDCSLCQAADNAVRLGVAVIVAAGNEGSAGAHPPFSIRHPGAARLVTTVGAVDKNKLLASFSSIGPSSARLSPGSSNRYTKPDVCAPGVRITSSVPGGGFASLDGTSMATPHVSGVAALMLQKRHSLRPATVKKLLQDTCEPLPYNPNEAGYGLISAYGAVLRVI